MAKKVKIELTANQLSATMYALNLGLLTIEVNSKVQGRKLIDFDEDFKGIMDKLDDAYHDAGFCKSPTCAHKKNDGNDGGVTIRHYKTE